MKITIYELLGMVKDGKAPKKIKYKNIIYQYDYEDEIYYYKDSEISKMFFDYGFENLNDEVEIIEEDKKIFERLPYYSMEKIQKAKNKDEWREERITLLEKRVNDLHIKMNDLLDYLKSKGDE